MNALLLLMGLLVLSYLGSFLVSGRALRGAGLPSGAEYVALGFVLGPNALGIVERSILASVEPIVDVALGWLALVIGLDFGFAGDRRVGWKSLVFGIGSALLTGGITAAAALAVMSKLAIVPTKLDAYLLAGGLGVVCAHTTRHAVRWVTERHRAEGRLSNFLNEISHADDVVPLLGLAILFALAKSGTHAAFVAPPWAWVGATIGLGLILGTVAALLLGDEFAVHVTWGVLFGTSLLAVGTASRLGLSGLAVTFFMGVAMAWVSKHSEDLRAVVAPTERPVLLPALVLAGARIDLEIFNSRYVTAIVSAAILARIVGKLLTGIALRGTRTARNASPLVGAGLLASGALSVGIALACAMRFPGVVGNTILATAAIAAVFGEFVAPVSLRRVLERVGEIAEPAPQSTDAPAEER